MGETSECSDCDKFQWGFNKCTEKESVSCLDKVCDKFIVKLYDANCTCCISSNVRFKDFKDNLFCSKDCVDWYYFGSQHCPKCDCTEYECVEGTEQDIEYQCNNCGIIYEDHTKKVRGVIIERGF